MRNKPSEGNNSFSFGARALILAVLTGLGCGDSSPSYYVEWGTHDHPGPSNCDQECLHLANRENIRGGLRCRWAFDRATRESIDGNTTTDTGEGQCGAPLAAGECDPAVQPVHFVPVPTAPEDEDPDGGTPDGGTPPADGGTPQRTTGFAICNADEMDCVSAQHGGGTPAGCEEDIGLFPGGQAGANCRERCQ